MPRILVFLLLCAAASHATLMGDAAAQMKAGEWRTLQTLGATAAFGRAAGGAVGNVLPYTDDLAWDPATRSVYFIGSDHQHSTGYARFIAYSESTNTWRELPRPFFFSPLTEDAMHGYEHTAINPVTGDLYHRPASVRNRVAWYNTATATWRSGFTIPSTIQPAPNVAIGIAYFPELPGLVCVDGNGGLIYAFSTAALKWSILKSGLTMGPYHNMIEYNPVHKVVVGGGGNGSRNLYKIDGAGNVVSIGNAPFEVRILSTVFTVDPVGGDYLFFTGSREFWSYNVGTGAWKQENGSNLPIYAINEGGAVSCVAATPVSTHGVNLFVSCNGSDSCWVSLYKRTAGGAGGEVSRRGAEKPGLSVFPSPVRDRAWISAEDPDIRAISFYGLSGALVEKVPGRAGKFQWKLGPGRPNGVYLARAGALDGSAAVRIVVHR